MRKPVSYTTTAFELFWIQLTWTFIAIGIMLAVDIIRLIIGKNLESFYSAAYISGNIYMLVIGIIAISFLTYYVENGVTRQNYFIGGILASIGLSIVIPILSLLVSVIEKFVINHIASFVLSDATLDSIDIDMDGNLIGEIVQSVILAPFVNPESNLILSLALFSLNIFMFYMVGWLIGAAFHRLGVINGIIFIIAGLMLIMMKDSMIRLILDLPIFHNFALLGKVPDILALPLVLAVVVVVITLNYLLIKRAPIKIK